MLANAKAIIAKTWKSEVADLAPGRHEVNETLLVRVRGHVERHKDQSVGATVSIPFITVVAFLLERVDVEQEEALGMLREALNDAMRSGDDKDAAVVKRIKDVTKAVKAVRKDLIDKLPRMHRSGKLDTSGLTIDVLAISDELEPLAVEVA